MAVTIQLSGVIKVGTGEITFPVSPSVTTIEEFHQFRRSVAAATTINQFEQAGLTSIDFCYMRFLDATTLAPTHALVLALTDIVAPNAPLIAGAPHQTEFLYINSTGTSALGIDITTVAACFVEGVIGGAA